MKPVALEHLQRLYANTDDPWDFRTSEYEQRRFGATVEALGKTRYTQLLEIGCGNGELARRLRAHTRHYVGVDASSTALAAARRAAPDARFEELFLPCHLPDGQFELILLSEILYFLDIAGIESLAQQLRSRWPEAELLCVNYLGPSGNDMQGGEAFEHFRQVLVPDYLHQSILSDENFRIDRLSRTP